MYSQELTVDQLRDRAPSIFAENPHPRVSQRYAFLSTARVLEGMQEHGFVPVYAAETRTRNQDHRDFVKHMIRFRHPSAMVGTKIGQVIPEVVLSNSHNLSASFCIDAGLFRLMCLNQITMSMGFSNSVRVIHSGRITVNDILDATYKVLEDVPALMGKVDEFSEMVLNTDERTQFARDAAALRWEVGSELIPVEKLLQPRRADDVGMDLWRTYNTVQENLIRGGDRHYNPVSGRRARVRGVKSVNEDLRINKALWGIACKVHDRWLSNA